LESAFYPQAVNGDPSCQTQIWAESWFSGI